jgi:uncharacterized membrane protein
VKVESFQHLLVRAVVTFVEVVLSTAVGANVFGWGVSGWQAASAAGVGAAISVIYNWVFNYRQKLDDEAGA